MTPRADTCAFWSILSLGSLIGVLVLIRWYGLDVSTIPAEARTETAMAEPAVKTTPSPSARSISARERAEKNTVVVPLEKLPSRLAVRRDSWSELDIPPERVVGIKFTLRRIEVRRKSGYSDFLYRRSNSPPRAYYRLSLPNPLEKFSTKPDTYWFEKETGYLAFRSADTQDEVIGIIWRE